MTHDTFENSEEYDENPHEARLRLGRFFAKKATEAMDKVWEEKGLTEQDMRDWTNEHNRFTPNLLE
jgi:hypothetical protein